MVFISSYAHFSIYKEIEVKHNFKLIGDFIAHIDIRDFVERDDALFRRSLMHDYWNLNGLSLKAFMHRFKLKNYLTFSKSSSVRFTWANSRSCSQLDHYLMIQMSFIRPLVNGSETMTELTRTLPNEKTTDDYRAQSLL